MTRIEHLQSNGIIRTGKPTRGFRYRRANAQNGHRKVSGADLKRIESLKIPPAWTDVAISAGEKSSLQAVGKDAAGRWQYLYHENHTRRQDLKKFKRLISFTESLPKARATVKRHLRQRGLGRERVMAAILKILLSCFMRPGSHAYASENGSYGIATLRPKHVSVKGDTVDFDFPGKSGVRQQRQLKDKSVAKVVRALLKKGGAEVFKYENGNGEIVNVTSRHINEYIKEVMGDRFSAKDFRTWAGTLVCACALARVGTEVVEKPTVRKRKIVEAIKETAEVLGNTPAVCRSSYISPEILDGFLKGKIIDNYFETLEDFLSHNNKKLHPAEDSLLRFLKARATR
jgi:DNA topoisomerase-1